MIPERVILKVLLTLTILLSGCDGHPLDQAISTVSNDKDSPSCKCNPEALSRLVLDKLDGQGIVEYNEISVPPDEDAVKKQFVILDRIDAWAATLKDRCLRDEYHQWMWFYRLEDNEGLDELRTHSQQKELDAYEAKERVIEEQKRGCDHCVPSPPKEQP